MFFHIFSQQTKIYGFNNFFDRYHLLYVTERTVFRIGFSFKTNSMEQPVAMGAFERKFIFGDYFSLVDTDTLRFIF